MKKNLSKRQSKPKCCRLLIFDEKPIVWGYIMDYALNRLHYGFKIKIPITFRSPEEWGRLLKITYALKLSSHI